MRQNDAGAIAEKSGFTHWGIFPVSGMEFLPEVRDMCAADKCSVYNRSWSRPPACGTPEEIAALMLFLASDATSFITGSITITDGGATVGGR